MKCLVEELISWEAEEEETFSHFLYSISHNEVNQRPHTSFCPGSQMNSRNLENQDTLVGLQKTLASCGMTVFVLEAMP